MQEVSTEPVVSLVLRCIGIQGLTGRCEFQSRQSHTQVPA